jgi:hypothetical protein
LRDVSAIWLDTLKLQIDNSRHCIISEAAMADNEKECVLVRDVHGTFYEIPLGIAENHMLKASELQSALQHFEGDSELVGMPRPAPMPRPTPVPTSPWAKMSW